MKIKCTAASITTTSMFLWCSKTRAVQAQNHNVSALQGGIQNHDFSKTLLAGDSCPALAQNQAWNYTISFKTCTEHTMPFHDCSGKSPRMRNTYVLNGLDIKFVSINLQIWGFDVLTLKFHNPLLKAWEQNLKATKQIVNSFISLCCLCSHLCVRSTHPL